MGNVFGNRTAYGYNAEPPSQTLSPGHVHIWIASTGKSDRKQIIENAHSLLNLVERERLQSIRSSTARDRFLIGRGMLHNVLAQYMGTTPGSVRLSAIPGEKPRIVGVNSANIDFNLSHCGDTIACAITRDAQLGIDVISPNRNAAADRIARTFFPEQEQRSVARQIGQNSGHARRLLALKESIAKAIGGSIWDTLSSVDLDLDPFGNVRWASTPPKQFHEGQWSLAVGDLSDKTVFGFARYCKANGLQPQTIKLSSSVFVLGEIAQRVAPVRFFSSVFD